ncbi:quinoprotein dehydrogenase-associated putative ABC transporter substrate-binding protein [Methyloceanibacter sp. wino2]|uniref:quinoprotein dehydrogenase-associated putative ABC transporter substrate-binding protein n=1 Tax=Methyloceanibacter sp. wino2 TaxID=2170729 RepID=UPI000D3EABEC|nr:quinoprotein dehydrogenase-associated putative ABC transporter substrate-binding protein [Methyloceanibacter sp. wino2]
MSGPVWAAVALAVAFLCVAGQARAMEEGVLRVCADPDNMPFSNDKEEGFENKLAKLIAERLDRELVYTWFPEDTGYVPNTIGENACAMVMGYAQGTGLIEDTNPYYYASYVLITRADDTALNGVISLSDPRLKSKRIGLVARTPPASILAMNGLIANSKPFDGRSEESQSAIAQDMIAEIVSGKLDAGLLWGPIGGYYAALSDGPLNVVPLVKERAGPATFYPITLGIRPNEPQFKHQVNKVLADNADEIVAILEEYNVPVLDREGQLLTAGGAAPAGQ